MFLDSKVTTIIYKNHNTNLNPFNKIKKHIRVINPSLWYQYLWFPWLISIFGMVILVGSIILMYLIIKRYFYTKSKTNLENSHSNNLMKLLRSDIGQSSFDLPYDLVERTFNSSSGFKKKNNNNNNNNNSIKPEVDPDPLFFCTKHFHSSFIQPKSCSEQSYFKGCDKSIITLTPQLLNFSSVQTRRRQKGLFENRRGSPGSLTLSLSPSVDSVTCTNSSPMTDKNRLESASLFLSAEQLIQRASSFDNFELCFQEFWNIPMNYANRNELSISGIGMKNRFESIIPNESTRVRLPQINNDVLSTYINANYIRGYMDAPKSFIATQGPLPTTLIDFWRMVWHCKSKAIVMVTKIIESNKKTCEWYLPININDNIQFGDIDVKLINILENSGYNVYELILENVTTTEKRPCRHFWFRSWPDQKVPENISNSLKQLENISNGCREDSTGPVIVHCSAGVGRTGCFIAFCIGKDQLLIEGGVDILRIVSHIRLDRGGCVQYNEQYQFLYESLGIIAKQHGPLPSVNSNSRKTIQNFISSINKIDCLHNYPLSAGRLDAYRRSKANAFDFDETVEDILP